MSIHDHLEDMDECPSGSALCLSSGNETGSTSCSAEEATSPVAPSGSDSNTKKDKKRKREQKARKRNEGPAPQGDKKPRTPKQEASIIKARAVKAANVEKKRLLLAVQESAEATTVQ